MRRSRIVLSMSYLFLAVLLGWYLRDLFDDSFKSNRGSSAQATQNFGMTGGSSLRPLPAPAPYDSSTRLGTVSNREPLADSGPEEMLTNIQSEDMEIDPRTGAIRFTPSESGTAQPLPQANVTPPDMLSPSIEIDPATCAIRFVQPATGAPQLPPR
jgi:hypothetical protein